MPSAFFMRKVELHDEENTDNFRSWRSAHTFRRKTIRRSKQLCVATVARVRNHRIYRGCRNALERPVGSPTRILLGTLPSPPRLCRSKIIPLEVSHLLASNVVLCRKYLIGIYCFLQPSPYSLLVF